MPLFCLLLGLKFEISSKTEAKYIHLKTLSATGRISLPVSSFCTPPVICCWFNRLDSRSFTFFGRIFLEHWRLNLLKLFRCRCSDSYLQQTLVWSLRLWSWSFDQITKPKLWLFSFQKAIDSAWAFSLSLQLHDLIKASASWHRASYSCLNEIKATFLEMRTSICDIRVQYALFKGDRVHELSNAKIQVEMWVFIPQFERSFPHRNDLLEFPQPHLKKLSSILFDISGSLFSYFSAEFYEFIWLLLMNMWLAKKYCKAGNFCLKKNFEIFARFTKFFWREKVLSIQKCAKFSFCKPVCTSKSRKFYVMTISCCTVVHTETWFLTRSLELVRHILVLHEGVINLQTFYVTY